MNRWPAALFAVALVAVAGCSRTVSVPSRPATDQPSASQPAGTAAASVQQCSAQGGRRIEINAGEISCGEAYSTAAAYDEQGDKYQHIGAFTCYSGTAQTAPIVLICTSERVEFSVSGQ